MIPNVRPSNLREAALHIQPPFILLNKHCSNHYQTVFTESSRKHNITVITPGLPTSNPYILRNMMDTQSFITSQMAAEADCSKVTIISLRRNLSQIQFAITSRRIVQYLA